MPEHISFGSAGRQQVLHALGEYNAELHAIQLPYFTLAKQAGFQAKDYARQDVWDETETVDRCLRKLNNRERGEIWGVAFPTRSSVPSAPRWSCAATSSRQIYRTPKPIPLSLAGPSCRSGSA